VDQDTPQFGKIDSAEEAWIEQEPDLPSGDQDGGRANRLGDAIGSLSGGQRQALTL
jgi:ABC-type uncharacterized transport system ATPase component